VLKSPQKTGCGGCTRSLRFSSSTVRRETQLFINTTHSQRTTVTARRLPMLRSCGEINFQVSGNKSRGAQLAARSLWSICMRERNTIKRPHSTTCNNTKLGDKLSWCLSNCTGFQVNGKFNKFLRVKRPCDLSGLFSAHSHKYIKHWRRTSVCAWLMDPACARKVKTCLGVQINPC